MKLDEVVPWGRTMTEYQLMFELSAADLQSKILGCGDGPASFNTEMTQLGHNVVSIDPIYQFSAEQIRQRVTDTYEPVISQVKQNPDRYLWKTFRDPDHLGRSRLTAMENFLLDYEPGRAAARYLPQSLPTLDFADRQFDLCLCSHLLFLYSEQLSVEFHRSAIQELLRVAHEVRIFPLLQLDCTTSPYVEILTQELSQQGFAVQILPVAYEFQRGGNRMLQLTHH
jgi:hypothetical protein